MKYLYETHLHTSQVSACAGITGAAQARTYKDKGYSGIIVTDHFINGNSQCRDGLPWKELMTFFASGYDDAKKEGDKIGLDVFFGWEFTERGSDFLTYGLNVNFLISHPGLDRLNIGEYSALVRASGGYIAQAHPFRDAPYIERKRPVSHKLLDGIEVFNGTMPDCVNKKALAFAKRHKLPVQAGSDSHVAEPPFRGGIILDEKARDIFDIINAIKAKKAGLILPGRTV